MVSISSSIGSTPSPSFILILSFKPHFSILVKAPSKGPFLLSEANWESLWYLREELYYLYRCRGQAANSKVLERQQS